MGPVEETEQILRSMRDMWDGEAVDLLDHALQCAGNALADDADDELVLASALHDIGHALGADEHRHDRAARDWLSPRFGERVGWLAGAHVAAKRYLVATEPDYAATLSGVSIATLEAQGGAGVDNSYTGHRWWPDAVLLRRYDDAAKVPGASAPSIADVVEVARRVLP